MKNNILKFKMKSIHIIFLFVLFASSCISHQKLDYIQGKTDDSIYFTVSSTEKYKINAGDELYIRVSSLDDVSYNFFETQGENRMYSYSSELSLSLITYTVNDSGYIYFPILEYVHVEDQTLEDLTGNLTEMLSAYFNQPTVIIKVVNKKITILGEVRSPGNYIYTQNRLNIFEALSLSGDITIHGNKKEVILLREKNSTILRQKLDLRKDDIIQSPFFYVEPGDVLYVKSRNSSVWSFTAAQLSLIFSAATTFALLYREFSGN